MRAGEALCAIDDESVVRVCGNGGVFGGEGDVEAADAEVWVLHVEVVGVAHGTVLEDRDADVACEEEKFIVSHSPFLREVGRAITHCSSIH